MNTPKIRFKGFKDDWEQRKLDTVAKFSKGSGYSKGDLIETGTPIILYGRLYTKYETSISDVDTYVEAKEGSVYSKGGEVIVPASGETAEDIARAATVDKSGILLGGDLNVVMPNEDINSAFLAISISNGNSQRELAKKAQGKSVVHIHNEEIRNLIVPFPIKAEQNRIVDYFSTLDHLITLHQRKAICTKNVRNNHILSIFLWERAVFMGKMILYHGSPNEMIHPIYGLGEDKHDYGRGFYLTANIELAKEWAVCRPDQSNGWVHKYELETDDLRILDFQQLNVLSWLAELMKHREASDSKRYRMLAAKFIEKYGIDTDGYDVIKGWRADASYFYIAKAFVRDEIDVDILEELLFLGDLGIQYCIKSEKGYANLHELESELLPVSFADFNDKYNERDIAARENMRKLIDSDANKVTKVFSTLI